MPYPNSQLDGLPEDFVGNTVTCLMELGDKGIPKDTIELKSRIDEYFRFCGDRGMRPGIESLCLALSTSRQNFWNWTQGKYKDAEWQEVCIQARQIIISFLECASLNGKLNPATSIFLLKNWANYADTVSLENVSHIKNENYISVSDLPDFSLEAADLKEEVKKNEY